MKATASIRFPVVIADAVVVAVEAMVNSVVVAEAAVGSEVVMESLEDADVVVSEVVVKEANSEAGEADFVAVGSEVRRVRLEARRESL